MCERLSSDLRFTQLIQHEELTSVFFSSLEICELFRMRKREHFYGIVRHAERYFSRTLQRAVIKTTTDGKEDAIVVE